MAELDVVKEQIAYSKFWLGIMVVTDLGLFGWLISHAGRPSVILVIGGWLAVTAIGVGILLVHRRIKQQIEKLRDL